MPRPSERAARAVLRASLVATCLAGATGCAERGDFGRVKESVWNRAIGATGSAAATIRGEASSGLLLTDEETVLRDRAWRYLVPAHDLAWFQRIVSELVATRVLPASVSQPSVSSYYEALMTSAERSPAPLYRRLSEDVAADMRLLPAFVASAEKVLAADRARLRVLGRITAPTPEEIEDVRARVTENRCIVAWVTAATEFRRASYTFALERLSVGSPELQAVAVERTLDRFVEAKGLLAALAVGPIPVACAWDPDAARAVPLRTAPIVAKG